MSTLLLQGFLALMNGNRKTTNKAAWDGKEFRVHHTHYTTCIQCTDGASLPAELRTYSTTADPILQDDTVAFVIAKCFFTTKETTLLEALYICKVPGNPTDDDYEHQENAT